MRQKYYSTGKFASKYSVTPDAVLKWIKTGKIKAIQTPGGHYRIPHDAVPSNIFGISVKKSEHCNPDLHYCWEYNTESGNISVQCRRCLVFRSRAQRCYELGYLSPDEGHMKTYCGSSCDQCDYYHYLQNIETL